MNAQTVTMDAVRGLAKTMFEDGYRFLTMSAVDLGDESLDLLYHYDKDLDMKHYRLTVKKGQAVPSVSPVYFCALLVENEIRDQFGVEFSDIALDFGGTLYLEDDVRTSPFCKLSVTEIKKEG